MDTWFLRVEGAARGSESVPCFERRRGDSIDDLEIAVAEYFDWFNHRRLHGESGLLSAAGFEDRHYRHNSARTTVGASVTSLQ